MKSSEIISSTKKCEHCSKWTNGEKAFCEHCGEILDKKYREERAELEREQREGSPMMKMVKIKNSENNKLLFWLERSIQSGQMVLIFLIAFVAIILALLPG
ncbi:MAG: hypothetical protein K9H61_02740 [Bacteroidia bacterium]|nr:hypothetical protein [Bacteroidia bacterium]MCF8425472.1 hypothetical protein [Bacteroidia bacterium]MCF8445888.1 hypothetical protein [Bacteroidia bacterium]